MKLTIENAKEFIGKKVRIVKICAPFHHTVEMLGKIDYIKEIYGIGPVFLKNREINMNPDWLELVDDGAIDIDMEYNENTSVHIEIIKN